MQKKKTAALFWSGNLPWQCVRALMSFILINCGLRFRRIFPFSYLNRNKTCHILIACARFNSNYCRAALHVWYLCSSCEMSKVTADLPLNDNRPAPILTRKLVGGPFWKRNDWMAKKSLFRTGQQITFVILEMISDYINKINSPEWRPTKQLFACKLIRNLDEDKQWGALHKNIISQFESTKLLINNLHSNRCLIL